MSQEIGPTNNAHHESISKVREAPLNSKYKTDEMDSKSVLKAQIVTRKSFTERMKTHRFFLVRSVYYIFYSVWAIVMAIGMFIAWFIAMLFI